MTFPKTLITAILIVAAAAQPVVAAIKPCCCLTEQVATASAIQAIQPVASTLPACCAAKTAEAEESLSACYAKKQQAHACSMHGAADGGPVFDQAGCCCVKPAPVVPGERTNLVQCTIASGLIDLAIDEPAPLVPAPALRRFEQLPGSHSLSGPSLLALLCVWRK